MQYVMWASGPPKIILTYILYIEYHLNHKLHIRCLKKSIYFSIVGLFHIVCRVWKEMKSSKWSRVERECPPQPTARLRCTTSWGNAGHTSTFIAYISIYILIILHSQSFHNLKDKWLTVNTNVYYVYLCNDD